MENNNQNLPDQPQESNPDPNQPNPAIPQIASMLKAMRTEEDPEMDVLNNFLENDNLPKENKTGKIIFLVVLILTIAGMAIFYYYFIYGRDITYKDIKNKYTLKYPSRWMVYKEDDNPAFFRKPFNPDMPLTQSAKDNMCGFGLASLEYFDMGLDDFLKNSRQVEGFGEVKKVKIGGNEFGIIEMGTFECPYCPSDLRFDDMQKNVLAYVTVNMKNQFYTFAGINAKKTECGREIEKILSTMRFDY